MPRQSNAERLALRLDAISAMDRGLWAQGAVFAGIDEAGCGPLAGPVVAGCVVMPSAPLLPGVDDSKKLTGKRREELYRQIVRSALYARVGQASVEEIERLNIRQATRLAMARAAADAPCGLFLVDGTNEVDLPGPQRLIIGGDASCYTIAAASIVAKVVRDRMMRWLDALYPQYGFATHKGYGTAAHVEAIRAHGPCPAHRRLFIRKIVPQGEA